MTVTGNQDLKILIPILIDTMLSSQPFTLTKPAQGGGNTVIFSLEYITEITISVEELKVTGIDRSGVIKSHILDTEINARIRHANDALKQLPLLKYIPSIEIEGVITPAIIGCKVKFPLNSAIDTSTITITREIFLDYTSPYLLNLFEQKSVGTISNENYLNELIKYSYRVKFPPSSSSSGVEAFYLTFRSVSDYIKDSYARTYYNLSTGTVIPYPPDLTEDELNAKKLLNKEKTQLLPENFNLVVDSLPIGQQMEISRNRIFITKKNLRGIDIEKQTGIDIFNGTFDQEIVDLFYPKTDSPKRILYFCRQQPTNTFIQNTLKHPYIEIIFPFLDRTQNNNTLDSNKTLLDRCNHNIENIDLILIPANIKISVKELIGVSKNTRVVLLRDFSTIDTLITSLDSDDLESINGVGDLNFGNYITGDLIRRHIDNLGIFERINLQDTAIMNSIDDFKRKRFLFKDLIHWIREYNSGVNIKQIILTTKDTFMTLSYKDSAGENVNTELNAQVSLVTDDNSSIFSSIQPKEIDKEFLFRLLLEISEHSIDLDSLEKYNYLSFKVENTKYPYYVKVTNNNNQFTATITFLEEFTFNNYINVNKGVNIVSSPSAKLRLSYTREILQGVSNKNILILDLDDSFISTSLRSNDNIVTVINEIDVAKKLLTISHSYDLVIINTIDKLGSDCMKYLQDNLTVNTTYIILTKYYLPEFVYRYVSDFRIFLNYLHESCLLYEDTIAKAIYTLCISQDNINDGFINKPDKSIASLIEIINQFIEKSTSIKENVIKSDMCFL